MISKEWLEYVCGKIVRTYEGQKYITPHFIYIQKRLTTPSKFHLNNITIWWEWNLSYSKTRQGW